MFAPDTNRIHHFIFFFFAPDTSPCYLLEPVPDSEEILFVADMKILGGGVGRRYKIYYLLKPISYTPAPGASHREIAGLRTGAEITSVGTIPCTRVGILCTRVSIHGNSTLNISPKLS